MRARAEARLGTRRGLALLPGLGAGLLLALSLPPWGWWPLAPLGYAVLYAQLAGQPWRRRLLVAYVAGLGCFAVGLFWMTEFTLPGGVLAVLLSAVFVGGAGLATPPARGRAVAFPAAMFLGEALRVRWPFGGVPLGGVPLGQAGGPAAPAVRVGGALVLVGLAALAGVALAEATRRRVVGAALAAAVVVAVVGVAAAVPAGTAAGRVRTGLVQGGGRRGYTALDTEEEGAYASVLAASARLRPPLDLVLWPEDVVHVDEPVARTPEGRDLSALAVRLHATVVAGVVQSTPRGFLNLAVAWDADGRIVASYDKVRRVPFGEYVPGRSLVEHLANLDAVPADAIAGHGPGLLRTPVGRLGVLISYEVFFSTRARSALRAGARLLLVPTNAASFSTSQVPTQEVAAARLRALETGRWVVQASPTGYSAVIDEHGRVLTRTVLGRRDVVQASVGLRTGRTPYVRWGDAPLVAVATLALAGSWAATRRRGPA